MESEKVLTFDEWLCSVIDGSGNYRDDFCLARQGMIPATEAIEKAKAELLASGRFVEIPEKWPEGSNGFVAGFTASVNEEDADYFIDVLIAYLPRKTPSWKPNPGDKVWWFLAGKNKAELFIFNNENDPWPGGFCALAKSLDEATLTRDQFRERGEYMEVK